MPRYDYTTKRLYVDEPLIAGSTIPLDRKRANYLLNVLRYKSGDEVLLYNGRDGEWLAELAVGGRKEVLLAVGNQTRMQPPPTRLSYLFAPLKKARLDYMVQKAVEMGAGLLQPVITEYTQSSKLNLERIEANIIEATQQCGVLAIPRCRKPVKLAAILENWPEDKCLIYCDEGEESQNPLEPLSRLKSPNHLKTTEIAVLIGPEGGFSENERRLLRSLPYVTPIPLGPRVLRADTAAVAALALVQATLGDWH